MRKQISRLKVVMSGKFTNRFHDANYYGECLGDLYYAKEREVDKIEQKYLKCKAELRQMMVDKYPDGIW